MALDLANGVAKGESSRALLGHWPRGPSVSMRSDYIKTDYVN
jgi:hypothetical protein